MQVNRWFAAVALLVFAVSGHTVKGADSKQGALANTWGLKGVAARSSACVTSKTGTVAIEKGIASIYEVTAPCDFEGDGPLVVFVNYASESDRDYFSMPSVSQARSTPRSSVAYTYRYMAERLAAMGFMTVRNDPLGVGCRPGEQAANDAPSPFCIRADETARVQRSDYAEVLGKVLHAVDASLSRHIDSRGVVFVAHSGTTLVVKDVFAGPYGLDTAKAGVVGVAALIGTGRANDYWQTSGVFKARIAWCEDHNTLDFHFSRCVKQALSDAYAVQRIPEDQRRTIFSKCSRIGADCRNTASTLLDEITNTVWRGFNDAAAKGETLSSHGGYVGTASSHLEIADSPDSPCSILIAMRPAVRFIYGGADIALSGEQQTREWISCGGSADDVTTLPKVGHMLGPNVHTGPMTEESARVVISAVVDVAHRLSERLSPP